MTEAKQRHGCLTVWLVLMIIVNSVTALIYLFAGGAIKQNLPNQPTWALPMLVVLCIGNVIFSIALFQWKKWGFFGFFGTSILALIVNLTIGLNIRAGSSWSARHSSPLRHLADRQREEGLDTIGIIGRTRGWSLYFRRGGLLEIHPCTSDGSGTLCI